MNRRFTGPVWDWAFTSTPADGLAGPMVHVRAPGGFSLGHHSVSTDGAEMAIRSYIENEEPGTADAPVVFLDRSGLIVGTYWDGVDGYAAERGA